MTTDLAALDAAIRQARHLLFAFDGPIRSVKAETPADSTTPTAPYIHEALAACRDSGRSAVVIVPKPPIDEPAYLDAHNLFTQITVIAASISDAVNFLEATPSDCLLITSSPADITAARAAGAPCIGYARTPEEAEHQVDAGASTYLYSMADLALRVRARPANQDW
jgi:beta-phosphoglucomutase-like phosphatase (HAD superfamily)